MSDKYELLRESMHELQREASARGGNNPRSQMILDLLADYEALQAECERLRKDAERYRWLRTRWGRIADEYDGDSDRLVAIRVADSNFEGWDVAPDSLDAAIDAAREETK